jgi:hypothetical protein
MITETKSELAKRLWNDAYWKDTGLQKGKGFYIWIPPGEPGKYIEDVKSISGYSIGKHHGIGFSLLVPSCEALQKILELENTIRINPLRMIKGS